GNIDYAEAKRWAGHSLVKKAIPQSLGDSWRGFRIVGTTPEYLDLYGGQLTTGRVWQASHEAVAGAAVAEAGLTLGKKFSGVHGLALEGHAHDEKQYSVVGILEPTGTVLDRLILTSLESVWLLHGHEAHGHDEAADGHDEDHHADHEAHDGHEEEAGHEDHAHAAEEDLEITALLINFKTPLAATSLRGQINRESSLLAASPALETSRILNLVGIGLDGFRLFGWVLVITAAFGLFVTLYHALESRRYDLAMMRCLGASRLQLIACLAIEALILTLIATLLGMLLGHGVTELVGRLTDDRLILTGATFLPQELWILPVGLLLGLAVAIIPAWRLYRADVSQVLSGS
ncbi:MAG: FtsX-like permease family protein, partial [Salinisphaeraceae bacterium]|nr:FtsX-like permease family protein [Salinisphaeraceae bacterium]